MKTSLLLLRLKTVKHLTWLLPKCCLKLCCSCLRFTMMAVMTLLGKGIRFCRNQCDRWFSNYPTIWYTAISVLVFLTVWHWDTRKYLQNLVNLRLQNKSNCEDCREKDREIEDLTRTCKENDEAFQNLGKEKDKAFQNLRKEKDEDIHDLKKKCQQKDATIQDLTMRLSEMASQRMREDNPCVEDLSDPYRATALAEKWTNVFRSGEYWTAFEAIHTDLDDLRTTETLLLCTKIVYKTCVESVDGFLRTIIPAMVAVLQRNDKLVLQRQLHESCSYYLPLLPEDFDKLFNDTILSCRHKTSNKKDDHKLLRVSLLQYLGKMEPPYTVFEKIQHRIMSKHGQYGERCKEFVHQIFQICFRMRTKEIPMVVLFHSGAGSPFDPFLYESEKSANGQESSLKMATINRPPLLRHEGGAVLAKGEATLRKPLVEDTKKNMPVEDNITSPHDLGKGSDGNETKIEMPEEDNKSIHDHGEGNGGDDTETSMMSL